jgi:hypothetical protein
MIKIDFERGESPYLYRDALHLSEGDYALLTTEEIEAMKDARYEAWLTIVKNPVDSIPEDTNG